MVNDLGGRGSAVYEPDAVLVFSTRLVDGGVTVEVARRQTDETWLWSIDDPNVRR